MKSSDLASGSAKLHKAWKKLRGRWETTTLQWHDSVSREFEEKHLAALEPQIALTLERMTTLAAILSAAELECDDRCD
jgi:hypothetical protein